MDSNYETSLTLGIFETPLFDGFYVNFEMLYFFWAIFEPLALTDYEVHFLLKCKLFCSVG